MKNSIAYLLLSPLLLLATPNPPKNLKLLPTHNSVTLSWHDMSDDEAGFKIYRDKELIMITQADVSHFKDSGLTPNTTYKYEVKATDEPFVIELDTLKAFPTAMGAGATVTGGRGGEVYYVTRLDGGDSKNKKGTFREAINYHKNKPRTIIFAVGGTFDTVYDHQGTLKNLQISRTSNFSIAGQSANDLGGIHFLGNVIDKQVKNFEGMGLTGLKRIALPKSHNFSIRYISAKGAVEEPTFKKSDDEKDKVSNNTVLDLQQCNSVIIDHFSGGYASYMLKFNKYNKETNRSGDFTLQYSLSHEGWGSHNVSFPTGFPYSNANDKKALDKTMRSEAWNNWTGKYDIAYNAYILVGHRQPANTSGGKSGSFILTSNYTYHWESRLGKHSGNAKLDLINNLFEESNYNQNLTAANTHKLYKMEFGTNIKTNSLEPLIPSIYLGGNRILKHDGTVLELVNEQDIFTTKSDTERYGLADEPVHNQYFRDTKQIALGDDRYSRLFPVPAIDTEKIKSYTLAYAGSGVRFYPSGKPYNVDELDSRYIKIAKDKSGPSFHYKKKLNSDEELITTGAHGIGDPSKFYYPDYPSFTRKADGTPTPWDGKSKIDPRVFDADLDGMPDVWEDKHGLFKHDKTDGNAIKTVWTIGNYTVINHAGYTNLEIYLADIAGDFHILAKQAFEKQR